MALARVPYPKLALSIDDQLQKLKDRGLVVGDDNEARRHLRHIGYYRLAGYTLPFQRGGRGPDRHHFVGTVSIDHVIDRYVFDRKLRLLIMEAIERIEVSIRASLSNSVAITHGPFWYNNPVLFDTRFDHGKFIEHVKSQIGFGRPKSQDTYIQHYYASYSSPDMPPSWMVFESISFGTISHLLSNLRKEHCRDTCDPFGLTHDVLASWMHAISYVRNTCAHHSRLWNRKLTIRFMVPKKMTTEFGQTDKIYSILVACHILTSKILPRMDWPEKLRCLVEQHPDVPISEMGFPIDWCAQSVWGFPMESAYPR